MQFWYFGDFGQFAYNLKESDKYLVQAKTLFEYNQYLLGYKALQKSNLYFQKVKPYLLAARGHGKNIQEKMNVLQQAALKHSEVLEKLQHDLPQEVTWQPEKAASTQLHIFELLQQSEIIRKNVL